MIVFSVFLGFLVICHIVDFFCDSSEYLYQKTAEDVNFNKLK